MASNSSRKDPAHPKHPGEGTARPSLAQVYDDHLDFVWMRLRALRVPASRMEDVVGDVWAQVCLVWDHPERGYDPARPIRPWLATIAFRVAVDRIRRLALEGRFMTPLEHDPAGSTLSPERNAEAMDVVRALAQLPEDKATALFLVEVEGLTAEDVAETMGISVHKARRLVAEARESLRARLERKGRSFGVAAPVLGCLADSDEAEGPSPAVRARIWRHLPDAIARRAASSVAERTPLRERFGSFWGRALLGAVIAGAAAVALWPCAPAPSRVAVASTPTKPPVNAPAVAPIPTAEVAAVSTAAPEASAPAARVPSLPWSGASGAARGSPAGAPVAPSAGASGTPEGPEYRLLAQVRFAQGRGDQAEALAAIEKHRRLFPSGPTPALATLRDQLEQQVLAMPPSPPPQ